MTNVKNYCGEGATHSIAPSRWGFTLAEVLVTLGIIGVVSAMTLPTLTKNHQRKVYATQLQKVYNEFSQASEAYITGRNAINLFEAGLSSQNGVSNFVQSQMKTVKNCETTFTDCFASEYKNMNGSTVTNYDASNSSCYALPSGASFCLRYGFRSLSMVVDVNGKQGPNILGRDLFDFVINNDGTIAVGGDVEELASDFSTNCGNTTTQSTYGACFAKILNDGWKMDY